LGNLKSVKRPSIHIFDIYEKEFNPAQVNILEEFTLSIFGLYSEAILIEKLT